MIKQLWAPRTFDGRTYHAVRGEGRTAMCGLEIPTGILWEWEVPRGCRKCPRCVYRGA